MSMYAIVAPGLSCIYTNYREVERVKTLYPYPKWAKFTNEDEAQAWLKRNTYGHGLRTLTSYGDIFPNLHVKAKYKIFPDGLCILYDMRNLGGMRVNATGCLVEYVGNYVKVFINNIKLSDESISSHMAAVYNVLNVIGGLLDIDIFLPYYSIYYCLTSYKGNKQRSIQTVQNLIQQRTGHVAFSMKFKEVL